MAQAQSKPANKGKKKEPPPVAADTVPVVPADTVDKREAEIKEAGTFAVYSKKVPFKNGTRLKLCMQLVSDEAILIYCMNDSLLRDPENYKVLFQQQSGDTNYVLVYADAFSKPKDKPACDAGKETKLFFVRWNTDVNKAIVKQRTVSSCMRGITNMTKSNIAMWDKSAPLLMSYHRGGASFVELKFDPAEYKRGIQTVSDTDNKSESRE
jgi:hypothetical protein